MHNSFGQSSHRQKFMKSLQEYQKKGILKLNKTQRDKREEDDIFVDLKNVWHTNKKAQVKQYEAIRSCELFSEARKATFVKLNYRNFECKDLNYQNVYTKLIKKRKNEQFSTRKSYPKGTMNITELWSEKKLKEVIGNLPFPRDRLKILKMYPNKKNNLYMGQGYKMKSTRRLATQQNLKDPLTLE